MLGLSLKVKSFGLGLVLKHTALALAMKPMALALQLEALALALAQGVFYTPIWIIPPTFVKKTRLLLLITL